MAADQKVWFITGVSRGFGKVLTEHALANNDIVIGTTRGGKASFEGDTRNVRVLPLEVTRVGIGRLAAYAGAAGAALCGHAAVRGDYDRD